MLPPPSDPTFRLPDPGEEAFFDTSLPEDAGLEETGAWDDDIDDGEEPENIDDDEPGGGSPTT